jgi:hypothetical protein
VPEPSARLLQAASLAVLVGLRWLARRRPPSEAGAPSPA